METSFVKTVLNRFWLAPKEKPSAKKNIAWLIFKWAIKLGLWLWRLLTFFDGGGID
jgi:hypothetical protein